MTDAAREPALSLDELRGGFWPDMTGGLCSLCHLAITRGDTDDPDPEHPDCVAAASEPPTRNGPQEAPDGPSRARTAPGGPVPASSPGAPATAASQRIDATHPKETRNA